MSVLHLCQLRALLRSTPWPHVPTLPMPNPEMRQWHLSEVAPHHSSQPLLSMAVGVAAPPRQPYCLFPGLGTNEVSVGRWKCASHSPGEASWAVKSVPTLSEEPKCTVLLPPQKSSNCISCKSQDKFDIFHNVALKHSYILPCGMKGKNSSGGQKGCETRIGTEIFLNFNPPSHVDFSLCFLSAFPAFFDVETVLLSLCLYSTLEMDNFPWTLSINNFEIRNHGVL